jgi:hypothetical protein
MAVPPGALWTEPRIYEAVTLATMTLSARRLNNGPESYWTVSVQMNIGETMSVVIKQSFIRSTCVHVRVMS